MSDERFGVTGRKAALIAGLGLLAMTIPAFLVEMFAFQQILVPGDAATTTANIVASESIFRAGIWGMLIVLICDVVVAWGLYILLEPVNAKLSLFTAWLRVVYAVVLGIALSALVVIGVLVGNADFRSVFEKAQYDAIILMLFNAYYAVWGAGFIIFGIHLLILGILATRSDFIPRIFGILLIIAGIGYIGEYTGRLLSSDFDLPLSIAGWGELLFMFWLLWAGRPVRWWRKAEPNR